MKWNMIKSHEKWWNMMKYVENLKYDEIWWTTYEKY